MAGSLSRHTLTLWNTYEVAAGTRVDRPDMWSSAKEFQSGVLDQLGVAEDMALSYIDSPDMQAEILAAYLPLIQGKARVAHQESLRHRRAPRSRQGVDPPGVQGHPSYPPASGETFKPLETASLKTIAAFLNSREGGTLLIGVADDGTIHGLRY